MPLDYDYTVKTIVSQRYTPGDIMTCSRHRLAHLNDSICGVLRRLPPSSVTLPATFRCFHLHCHL